VEHAERFRGALRTGVAVQVVTLWAPSAKVVEREAARPDHERLGVRVVECWNDMAAHLADLGGSVIDACGPVDEVRAALTALTALTGPTIPTGPMAGLSTNLAIAGYPRSSPR
jgi:hypothetical protein